MAIILQDFLAEEESVHQEICTHLKMHNDQYMGHNVLKVVLHTIRNSMDVEQKVYFMSYLPSSLLAIFSEDWNKTGTFYKPLGNFDNLLQEIIREARDAEVDCIHTPSDAKRACKSVFDIIAAHTSDENLKKIQQLFPSTFTNLGELEYG